ncbi:conserved hypothetical protein [Ricinus communis]|uniref:Uncharacterized protein n=1 Tax=Ricinus communis TaxID=3988 RepID=B9SSI4_RICCO|nr:conserved hypothetical protein [Ricinus communis]
MAKRSEHQGFHCLTNLPFWAFTIINHPTLASSKSYKFRSHDNSSLLLHSINTPV